MEGISVAIDRGKIMLMPWVSASREVIMGAMEAPILATTENKLKARLRFFSGL
jgi:hypothetical protein